MNQYIKKINGEIIDLGNGDITYDTLNNVIRTHCQDEQIEEIMITKAQIGNDGALFLNSVLQGNQGVKLLHIESSHNFLRQTDNRITADGMRALAQGLYINKSLKSVTLKGHNFGAQGAIYLANQLHRTKFTDLNLDDNNMSPDDMIYFFNKITNSVSIKNLSISGNPITVRVAERINACVANTSALESLTLSRTYPTLHGLTTLIAGIGANRSLKHIDLSFNNIGASLGLQHDQVIACMTQLREACNAAAQIEGIDLTGNMLSTEPLSIVASLGTRVITEPQLVNPVTERPMTFARGVQAAPPPSLESYMATQTPASSSSSSAQRKPVEKPKPLRM